MYIWLPLVLKIPGGILQDTALQYYYTALQYYYTALQYYYTALQYYYTAFTGRYSRRTSNERNSGFR